MQTIRTGCLLSMLMFAAFAAWLASDLLRGFLEVVAPVAARTATEALALTLLCLRAAGGMALASGLAAIYWLLRRQRNEHDRQRDGAFALREYWLESPFRRLLNWLAGRPSARVIYDPNANLSHAAVIHNAVYVVEPAAGWDRQLAYQRDIERTRRAEAVAPGDGVLGLPWFGGDARGGIANAATGRLLAGAYDKTPKAPVVDAPLALPAPRPVDVPLDYALERTESQAWPLGYAADGAIAWFNPAMHAHVAIVGGTGTGKTTSVGYLLACHALRQGWHVIILDADDGSAWGAFGMQAELHATDATQFAPQIAALHREFERRMHLLAEAGAPDVSHLAGVRRVLVVIEEYGDLSHTLRRRDRSEAAAVDGTLDTLLRRGRKAGVHLALLDQYPEHWSNQIIANTKFRVVFQLGPNQGAKMEEYDAAKLPPRGEFLLRGDRYTAWHAAPELRRLLVDVPAMSVAARLLDTDGGAFGRSEGAPEGEATRVAERPNATQPNAEPLGPTDLQAAVWGWRDAHPAGAQAEMRADFAARGIDIARGYAHECWHKWPGQPNRIDLSTDAGRAAFAALAPAARLPSGDKLGTDITGGA